MHYHMLPVCVCVFVFSVFCYYLLPRIKERASAHATADSLYYLMCKYLSRKGRSTKCGMAKVLRDKDIILTRNYGIW